LERLAAGNAREALDFLARRPFENVFLQWLIENGRGGGMRADNPIVLWRSPRSGAISGAAYFGPQLVLAGEDPSVVDAFAIEARRYGRERAVVGPKPLVERFWRRVAWWHRAPSAARATQPLYVLDRPSLRGSRADAAARRARRDEARLLAQHSALMMRGELGYDPRASRPGFEAGVARLVEQGWWWVLIEDELLRFACNIGPWTQQTAQVQGVWTPPESRGKGYARRGMASVCDQLLDEFPTLSLYVNDFNHRAIALYERVGFRQVGVMASLLFH
jgi:RimJ/RimL family protein N-acetyltransferase